MKKMLIFILFVVIIPSLSAQSDIILEAPDRVPRFEVAEFVVRVKEPSFKNPFTDVELI